MGDRATIDMGPKQEGYCGPFAGVGGAASPSNTMWPGLMSTSVTGRYFSKKANSGPKSLTTCDFGPL